MKKLVLSVVALLSFAALNLQAQVTVTYKVDITAYLSGGATLGANGIRVGGNFADQGATVTAGNMVNWSPSDANSAMTDMGNNIWSVAVTYPATSVGATQTYKFVNNDWGTNEGTDPANTIASGGCGVDDGSGNINRTLVIPATNTEICFVWDACSTCGGTSVKGAVVNKLAIYPNPTSSTFRVELSGNGAASASITDITGKVVRTLSDNILSGEISISDLNAGVYMVTLTEGTTVSQAPLMITK
jgi:hypothetical protein